LQSSTSTRRKKSSDKNSYSSQYSVEQNKQILERFFESIKSEVHRKNVINYIHAYMKFWHLYEEEKDGHDDVVVVYRYDWLIGEDDDDNSGNIRILQDKVIQFIIQKKKEGLGSNGLDNYINPLRRFYRVNGVKGIDWEVVREYRPVRVKKTHDREYNAEEVIAIEEKLDVRGKVASGLMRGSGVRRGAEPSINVGDLIPLQTKYGKIYKIGVY
jgi:hypothetical protein